MHLIFLKWGSQRGGENETGEPISLQEISTSQRGMTNSSNVQPHRPDSDVSGSVYQRLLQSLRKPISTLKFRTEPAWRSSVIVNVCLAVVVLTIAITTLYLAAGGSGSGIGVLQRGNCDRATRLDVISHAIINILSTLLLSASNYTMQVLLAPSREDIDTSHGRGIPLSIGCQSLDNLKFVRGYRRLLWGFLAMSSITLHVVSNAVVYPTIGATAYMITVASPEFLRGANFSLLLANRLDKSTSHPLFWTGRIIINYDGLENIIDLFPPINGNDRSAVQELQKKAQNSELVELNPDECQDSYRGKLQTKYRNVIAVSDHILSDSSVVWVDHSSPVDATPGKWMSQNVHELSTKNQNDSVQWSLGFYGVPELDSSNWTFGSYPISKCLVEETGVSCALRCDLRLLSIAIAGVLVQVIAMIATLILYRHPALVTLGDGIASFLERPDATTVDMCIATQYDFRTRIWRTGPRMYKRERTSSIRSAAASKFQWAMTVGTSTLILLATANFFVTIYTYEDDSRGWFSSSVTPHLLSLGGEMSETALLIIANIPQLVLSFNYMFLNQVVTSMATSREWSLFAHQRKGLRTSQPRGDQRSTYWLQIPLKYSIPLMLSSAALHYLASQSLFFGSVKYYAYEGEGAEFEGYTGLGYSRDAIQIFMATFIIPLAVAVAWGGAKEKPGIPPAGLCSLAISAACHPPAGMEDAHLQLVQWGETPREGLDEIRHCSFSSGEVALPAEGRKYA